MKKLTEVLTTLILSPLLLIGGISFVVVGAIATGWQLTYKLFGMLTND